MAECCPICRDPLNVSETGKVELSCSHEFHLACITRWFSTGGNTSTCPICRAAPKEKETVSSSDPSPNVPPIDVNAANALAAQRATVQRQRDDVRAQIHLQLNMLDQFSRDIQRMRNMVMTSLNDIDNQINWAYQANLNINNRHYNDNIIHHDQR
jgi:uncharacterized protein YbaR (Trm112 family)